MVPGMGAKISVLIKISFASSVYMIERFVNAFSNLYLKGKLKSSAYICRLMPPFATPMPARFYNPYNFFSSGAFYATVF
jgi:hypothetical protein